MPVTLQDHITVEYAAELLQCSTRTVRRRIADGTLPAVHVHDRYLLSRDAIDTYIADRTVNQ